MDWEDRPLLMVRGLPPQNRPPSRAVASAGRDFLFNRPVHAENVPAAELWASGKNARLLSWLRPVIALASLVWLAALIVVGGPLHLFLIVIFGLLAQVFGTIVGWRARRWARAGRPRV